MLLLLLLCVLLVGLPNLAIVESRRAPVLDYFEYCAMSCRAYSASLEEFGGVGDGTTLNTKAFQAAIENLSQYAASGGSHRDTL